MKAWLAAVLLIGIRVNAADAQSCTLLLLRSDDRAIEPRIEFVAGNAAYELKGSTVTSGVGLAVAAGYMEFARTAIRMDTGRAETIPGSSKSLEALVSTNVQLGRVQCATFGIGHVRSEAADSSDIASYTGTLARVAATLILDITHTPAHVALYLAPDIRVATVKRACRAILGDEHGNPYNCYYSYGYREGFVYISLEAGVAFRISRIIAGAHIRSAPADEPMTHIMQEGERERLTIGLRFGFVF